MLPSKEVYCLWMWMFALIFLASSHWWTSHLSNSLSDPSVLAAITTCPNMEFHSLVTCWVKMYFLKNKKKATKDFLFMSRTGSHTRTKARLLAFSSNGSSNFVCIDGFTADNTLLSAAKAKSWLWQTPAHRTMKRAVEKGCCQLSGMLQGLG